MCFAICSLLGVLCEVESTLSASVRHGGAKKELCGNIHNFEWHHKDTGNYGLWDRAFGPGFRQS